jgi:hypothetical protein
MGNMTSAYESAAKRNGEVRIYLETPASIDLDGIQAQLGYQYAYARPHSTPADPFDCAFGDPRPIGSEAEFFRERDRLVQIFAKDLPSGWDAEFLYYPPNCASAIYHWSK